MPHIPWPPGGDRVHCPSSLSPLSGHLGGFSQVDKSLLNVIMKPLGKLAGNRSDIGNVGVHEGGLVSLPKTRRNGRSECRPILHLYAAHSQSAL